MSDQIIHIDWMIGLESRWFEDFELNHSIWSIDRLDDYISWLYLDPIRTFFIKAHVDHAFNLKDNRIYKWFRSQANEFLTFRLRRTEEVSLNAIWDDRKSTIDQLHTWLIETADTFIILQGPRGSGKKELVLDQALRGRPNTLLIDCKPIQVFNSRNKIS